MVSALYHQQKRKRIHQKLEKYPHPNRFKRFMDRAVYAAGILGPIMTIPQLTKIWIDKNAAGVSVISWAAYMVGAVFWVIYGLVHKEKPIVLTYTIWFFMELAIVIGVVLHN